MINDRSHMVPTLLTRSLTYLTTYLRLYPSFLLTLHVFNIYIYIPLYVSTCRDLDYR